MGNKKDACIIVLLVLLFSLTSSFLILAKQALVIVPIADLVHQPLQPLLPNHNIVSLYKKMPLAHVGKKPSLVCPRLHQLLFNEIVDVITEQKNEVCIKIHNAFYNDQNNVPQTRYWTLKENIITFDALSRYHIDNNSIPKISISQQKNLSTNNEIALLYPFYERTTKQTYSAGTRFVLTKKQSHKNTYSVFLFDRKKNKVITTTLPKQLCITQKFQNKQEQIKKFVQILKQWANNTTGTIPYLWGGVSFSETITNFAFTQNRKKIKKRSFSYFAPVSKMAIPKSGFDCSGLILRAAQLCGIPYFYKNTSTLAQELQPIMHTEKLSDGDLIWLPGHVLIAANIQKNMVIEARGYAHGFGKVQEIALNKVFKNIETFDDLTKAFLTHKTIERLDIKGKVADRFPQFKLIKLASVWK